MVRSPFLDSDFFKQGPAYKKDGPDRKRIYSAISENIKQRHARLILQSGIYIPGFLKTLVSKNINSSLVLLGNLKQ